MSGPSKGAQQLRAARLRMGGTMRAMGARFGVSEATLSRWEAGVTRPTPERMKELQDVLEIPMADWMEDGSVD